MKIYKKEHILVNIGREEKRGRKETHGIYFSEMMVQVNNMMKIERHIVI